MYTRKLSKMIISVIILGFILTSCSTGQTKNEVNVKKLLPGGAANEIFHGYPDFKVTLVDQADANVSVKFGEKFLCVNGVDDEKVRERLAKYVLQYFENPNKKAEDKAKRLAYEKLPPKEKMNDLIKRIKQRYPDFNYKWVGLGESNVKVEYGDNSLLISGMEPDGAREEYAHGIIRIQKEIDKLHKGEQEEHDAEHEHGGEGGHRSEGEGEHGGGGEGEESGTRLSTNATYDTERKGVRLILKYDNTSSSFIGTVENVTSETIQSVRVEVHLSNGVELGPTKPINLVSGKKENVKLSAKGQSFEWWKAHPEAGEGEHEEGHEGEHENGGEREGGEHRSIRNER